MKEKKNTFITAAIWTHCSRVGSQPVGLCAQEWSIITEFGSAFDRSSRSPSISIPRFPACQYRYANPFSKPACWNTSLWFSENFMLTLNTLLLKSYAFRAFAKLVLVFLTINRCYLNCDNSSVQGKSRQRIKSFEVFPL